MKKTINNNETSKKISESVDELKKLLDKAKDRYKKMDDKSKTKVIAGITGSIALLIGAVSAHKMKDKKDK